MGGMKILGYGVAVLVLLVGGFYAFNNYIYTEKQGDLASDYQKLTISLSGQPLMLGEGGTKYFGNVTKGDLNKDGIVDLAFLITHEPGGSGTFFYLVGAIQTLDGKYRGTEAMLIGDRIAPQTTEFRDGLVLVNYADRKPGEPFTTAPSVAKSLYLKYDPVAMDFGEVVQNFEGEADPKEMTLTMKPWMWVSALYNDGTELKPKQAGVFTLTFGADGKFTATTDCNAMGGSYSTNQGALSLSNIYATKKHCEGSQEADFAKLLEHTASYLFTSKGELILEIKYDSGTVTFR